MGHALLQTKQPATGCSVAHFILPQTKEASCQGVTLVLHELVTYYKGVSAQCGRYSCCVIAFAHVCGKWAFNICRALARVPTSGYIEMAPGCCLGGWVEENKLTIEL